jgi:hypothetical protein
VQTAKKKMTSTRALVRAVNQTLRVMFSNAASLLGVFGLAPVKVPAPKLATKVAAAAKAKVTRAERGIMGKKQRRALAAAPPEA